MNPIDGLPPADVISAASEPPPGELARRRADFYRHWYKSRMTRMRVGYQGLEIAALALAGVTTVLAATSQPALLTATVAASVAFVHGTRRIFDWESNWLAFSKAWSAIDALLSDFILLNSQERDAAAPKMQSDVSRIVVFETDRWAVSRGSEGPAAPST